MSLAHASGLKPGRMCDWGCRVGLISRTRDESHPSWSRAASSMQDFGTSHWRSTGYKLMRLPRCSMQTRQGAPVLIVCVVEMGVAYAADVLGGAIVSQRAETVRGLGRAVAWPRDRARPRQTRWAAHLSFMSASTGSRHTQKGTNDVMGQERALRPSIPCHATRRHGKLSFHDCPGTPTYELPRDGPDRPPFRAQRCRGCHYRAFGSGASGPARVCHLPNHEQHGGAVAPVRGPQHGVSD